jgi:acyl-CoA-binding protein
MFKSGNKESYIPKYIDIEGRKKYDEMVKLKNTTVKYTKKNYEDMAKEYKKLAREEASRRGFDL